MDPPPVLEEPARRSIRLDAERTASATALPVDELVDFELPPALRRGPPEEEVPPG